VPFASEFLITLVIGVELHAFEVRCELLAGHPEADQPVTPIRIAHFLSHQSLPDQPGDQLRGASFAHADGWRQGAERHSSMLVQLAKRLPVRVDEAVFFQFAVQPPRDMPVSKLQPVAQEGAWRVQSRPDSLLQATVPAWATAGESAFHAISGKAL